MPHTVIARIAKRIVAIHLFLAIIAFAISPKLNAVELSTLCAPNSRCEIRTSYPLVTNHGTTIITPTGYTGYDGGIYVDSATITSFINYGKIITNTKDEQRGTFSFSFVGDNGNIQALTNYGTLSGGVNANSSSIHITNYGTMGGASTRGSVTIANYGEINLLQNGNGKKYHFGDIYLTIQAYAMKINEKASVFNAFSKNASDNSHLVLDSVQSVKFADKHSKLILDFGSGFEFGAGYLFSKLVVDTSGKNALGVDLSRLIPRSDIYHITQQNDKFVVNLKPESSTIGNLYKANVRTMNNFYTLSNAMIFPRKSYHSQNLGNKNQSNLVILREQSDRRISNISSLRDLPTANRGNPHIKETIDSALDSAIPLKSYESFAYRSESQNRRIQRQNKRNYNRRLPNQSTSQNLKENQRNLQNLNADSTNRNYYFILTPFINHNYFFESGRYNLSGFDYGFLTAFSGKIAESNHLGTYFIMSYGSLNDKQDKDFNIKSLNLNLGLNYKLDLIWDMYLKARGDFFYFLNQVKTLTMFEAIKPNNLGFGVSVAYGKEWDFRQGGVLGLEVGLDYKALQSSTISLQNNATKSISETYKKSLYNLIYADLGLNYNKYFGSFGINAGFGIRGNITANKLATSKIYISNFNRDIDLTLDNDMFLGYANLGASYMLNTKNFDMEFSLAYYGNYGDRGISNGGGMEWRVVF